MSGHEKLFLEELTWWNMNIGKGYEKVILALLAKLFLFIEELQVAHIEKLVPLHHAIKKTVPFLLECGYLIL